MTDSLAALEQQRLDADRSYNEALTAFDSAVVAAASHASLQGDDIGQLTTALVLFLQKITAFVETKDRELQARIEQRFDQLTPGLAMIDELRTRVGVLQRAVDRIARDVPLAGGSSEAPAAPSASPTGTAALDEVTYVGFEDEFRGTEEAIEARLQEYVPLFSGATDVLDLGCGRGEFLAALARSGIRSRGVDLNAEMAAVARGRGVDAVAGDALLFLTDLPDESLGGVMAAQVVEHLQPSYLLRLLSVAHRKLRHGAPIVVETINPACWLAFFSSYIRDITHVRPIHPETLQYLLRANGFERLSIRFSAPVPDHMKMKPIELGAETLASADALARGLAQAADVVNANSAILNNLLFTHLDYAAIGYRA
jgi:SAM-dependent methyltransferase